MATQITSTWFPSQRACNSESIPIPWRHHYLWWNLLACCSKICGPRIPRTCIVCISSLKEYKHFVHLWYGALCFSTKTSNFRFLMWHCIHGIIGRSLVVSKKTVMQTFKVFIAVNLNKHLNKQSSFCWFEMPPDDSMSDCNVTLLLYLKLSRFL